MDCQRRQARISVQWSADHALERKAIIRSLLTVLLTLSLVAPAYAQDEGPSEPEIQHAQRKSQLNLHQGLGIATVTAMATTAGLGLGSVYLNKNLMPAHIALGGLTTGLYLTAASLALSSPPSAYALDEEGGTVSTHRNLAWLHAAGLATTVAMGFLTYYGTLRDPVYHGIAGGTTLGLMTVSAGVIAFDF